MGFEASDKKVNDVFNNVVFDIPKNQRKYVWSKTNLNELFDDILISCNVTKRPHFIGSIVLKNCGKKYGLSQYTIIDGQQRITTIIILLTVIIRMFKEYEAKNEFEGTTKYVFSKDNRNTPYPVMSLDNNLALCDLINSSIKWECSLQGNAFLNTALPLKKDKAYKEAFNIYYSKIKEYIKGKDDKITELLNIRDTILDMDLIRIVAGSEEDSYTIFEILNARGQALEDHELLKNYMMRYIIPIENRDCVKTKWESIEMLLGKNIKSFVKHYATHKFDNSTEKSAYRIIQKSTKGQNISDLLDDMVLKATYYNKFVLPKCEGDDGNCTITEKRIFSFFKAKRAQQFRPILMSIMHNKDLNNIDESKYNEFLKYIYNFFVCFTIIGKEKSNRLEDVVYKYAPILENNFSKENMNEFAIKIKKKIPSNEWFLNAFKNIGWSDHVDIYKGQDNKNITKLVLQIVEEYTAQRPIIDDFTIEHILPDSQNKEENCQIGNLIPLEEALNEKCSNKTVPEKIAIYSLSYYVTAKRVSERYSNQVFDPSKRTELISKLIYNNILNLNQFDYSMD